MKNTPCIFSLYISEKEMGQGLHRIECQAYGWLIATPLVSRTTVLLPSKIFKLLKCPCNMIFSGYFKIFSFCLFVFFTTRLSMINMRFLENESYLWFVELLEYFFFLLTNLIKFWSLCFQITFSTLHPYLFLFFLWTPITHIRPSDIFS